MFVKSSMFSKYLLNTSGVKLPKGKNKSGDNQFKTVNIRCQLTG